MDTNKFNEAMIAASIRAKDTGEKCYVFRIPLSRRKTMNNVTIRTVPQFTIRLLDNSLALEEWTSRQNSRDSKYRLKALSELVQFALEELTARYRTAAHSAAQQVSA